MAAHIRQPLPPKRGNSFYKDTTVRAAHTLCGAPVTDRDVDYRTAGTNLFAHHVTTKQFFVCALCARQRETR